MKFGLKKVIIVWWVKMLEQIIDKFSKFADFAPKIDEVDVW